MSGSPVIPQQSGGLNGLLSALSAPAAPAGGEAGAMFANIFSQQNQQLAAASQAMPGGQALPPAVPGLPPAAMPLSQLEQSLQQLLNTQSDAELADLPEGLRQQLTNWLAEFSDVDPQELNQAPDRRLLEEFTQQLGNELGRLTQSEPAQAGDDLPPAELPDSLKSLTDTLRSEAQMAESHKLASETSATQGAVDQPTADKLLRQESAASAVAQSEFADDDAASAEVTPLGAQLAAWVRRERADNRSQQASVTPEPAAVSPDKKGESEPQLAVSPLNQAVQQAIDSQNADPAVSNVIPQAQALKGSPIAPVNSADQTELSNSTAEDAIDNVAGIEADPLSADTEHTADDGADVLWAAQSGQAGADNARQANSAPAAVQAQPQNVQADARNSQSAAAAAMQLINAQADAPSEQDADTAQGNRGESGLFQSQLSNAQQQRAVTDQQQLQQSMQQGPRLATPAWQQHVGERLVMMVGQGKQTAQINLDPPELGALQIRIQVDNSNGQVSVNFSSPHLVVRDAVEGSMVRLREMFAEQGLQLGDASVGDQGQQDSRRHSNGSDNGYPYAGAAGAGADAAVPENARALSLVDFYA